jgi:WD40 repeat protein/MinD-like ATPase involved in chromosome partitioning or flagellar assembly
MICTFYSYKGGVGRSMALSNVAELFYQFGMNVLVIDWDLEAPGLERFFVKPDGPITMNEILDRPGLIDILLRYKQQMAHPLHRSKDLHEDLPFEQPEQYAIDLNPTNSAGGRLRLISAGRRSETVFADYADAVLTFNWDDFYENWQGELYFEWFREKLESMADIVLIDSRTGVTEMGGVCTYQLADIVILLCAPNQQNIDGTSRMAENFLQPEVRELRRDRALDLVVVPARVEDRSEGFLLDAFRQQFNDTFDHLMSDRIRHDLQTFWNLKIPYVPFYAFNEQLAVREHSAFSEDLIKSFIPIAASIARLAPKDTSIRSFVNITIDQFQIRDGLTTIDVPKIEGELSSGQIIGSTVITNTTVGRDIYINQIFHGDTVYNVQGLSNPYPGIVNYTYNDRDKFSGRENITNEAVARLTKTPNIQPHLLVTGASGSGKTSFVQASLIPALEYYYQQKGLSLRWTIEHLSIHPFNNLVNTLRTLGVDNSSAKLINNSDKFDIIFKEQTSLSQATLLVIDQFEEIFTQVPIEERNLFLDLMETIFSENQITHILIIIRADFLSNLLSQDKTSFLFNNMISVQKMNTNELVAAIQRPLQYELEQRHLSPDFKRFEPALLERLAEDVGQEATYLPLLQFTLQNLWTQGNLTLENYQGLGDAIESFAEHIYCFSNNGNLRTPSEQKIIMQILLDLVDVSLDGIKKHNSSHPREKSVLCSSYDRSRLVDELIQARLLSARIELQGSESIEIIGVIHESLIHEWDRLTVFINEERILLERRAKFESLYREWLQNDRSNRYLLSEIRLSEAKLLQNSYDIALQASQAQELFIRSLKYQRIRKIYSLGMQTLMVVMLAIFLIFTVKQYYLSKEASSALLAAQNAEIQAEEQRNIAKSQQLAAESRVITDTTPQLLLAIEAVEHDYNVQSDQAIRRALGFKEFTFEQNTQVSQGIWSPNGQAFLTLSLENNTTQLWEINGTRRTVFESDLAVAWSPDGQLIATATVNGQVHIRDINGKLITMFQGNTDRIVDIAWRPDGQSIAVASADATVIIISVDGQVLTALIGHTDGIFSIEWSPDGQFLATSSADATARIWRSDGTLIQVLAGHRDAIRQVAWSPNGESLATASDDGTVLIWSLEGQMLLQIEHNEPVLTVMWNNQGTSILTVADKEALVWSTKGQLQARLIGHTQEVISALWNADGTRIVTASFDKTARVWKSDGTPQSILEGHGEAVLSALWDKHGSRILTTSNDETARIWLVQEDDLLALASCMAKRGFTDEELVFFRIDQPLFKFETRQCPPTLSWEK